DAKFFPKSKRICDSDTRATVLVVQVVTVRRGWLEVVPPEVETFWSRAAVQEPVICGSSGASAWSTRNAAAMSSLIRALMLGWVSSAMATASSTESTLPKTCDCGLGTGGD